VLFVIFIVWATDVAAYFGGRSFGGPKLWPRVSPKKTWSGATTGLFAALCAGGLTAGLTGAGDWRLGVLIAAPLSVISQLGDLLESALKRRFGVKDSGHVIPGHGGVLDRLDGLFAAAALALLMAAAGLGGGILNLPRAETAQTGAAS
jgi:phosphatidate cytidylyltransferase